MERRRYRHPFGQGLLHDLIDTDYVEWNPHASQGAL